MSAISVNTIRYLDSFSVQDRFGDTIMQSHPLTLVNAYGQLTNQPVKDVDGNTYCLDTANLSRELSYGLSPYDGNLYAYTSGGSRFAVDVNGNPLDETAAKPLLGGFGKTYDIAIDGRRFTDLSFTRLLYMVCINRAEIMERILVRHMADLADQTALLVSSSDLIETMLNGSEIKSDNAFSYTDGNGASHSTTIRTYLSDILQINSSSVPSAGTWNSQTVENVISAIQQRQDQLNSVSQESVISMQSLLNQRNQSYLLNTNTMKLLWHGELVNARNL